MKTGMHLLRESVDILLATCLCARQRCKVCCHRREVQEYLAIADDVTRRKALEVSL